MADLTPTQIKAMAAAMGLAIAPEDLPEVTYRVNALQEALATLEHPDLDAVEPDAVSWLREG